MAVSLRRIKQLSKGRCIRRYGLIVIVGIRVSPHAPLRLIELTAGFVEAGLLLPGFGQIRWTPDAE